MKACLQYHHPPVVWSLILHLRPVSSKVISFCCFGMQDTWQILQDPSDLGRRLGRFTMSQHSAIASQKSPICRGPGTV